MPKPAPTREAVLRTLQDRPQSRRDLEQRLGVSLQGTLSDMKRKRLIHVHGWIRGGGTTRSPRMIYALGDLPDAPKLLPDRLAKFKRYYQKHKAKIKEKRRLNFHKYSKKAAEAQRRLRARKRLKNPFIQLNKEMFNALRRRASKAVQGKRLQGRSAKDAGDGECAGRTGD